MQAVRQIQQVKNGSITVQLPADFPTDEVEVIVLPAQSKNGVHLKAENHSPNSYKAAVQDFLAIDTTHFTAEQLVAYARTCALLQRGRAPGELRVFGVFEGLVKIADDFDDADDIVDLFYGSETDEYGISLP